MGKDSSTNVPTTPLSAADLQRFHRDAPAAVKRRGGGFFFEQSMHSFELILMGTVPVVGLLAFDWSGVALLVFMLAGIWTAIFCDLFKFVLLRPIVAREAEAYTNDHFVWVVADALRERKNEVPVSQASAVHLPGLGLIMDFLFGGVSTLVIVVVMRTTEAGFPGEVFDDRGYLLALAAFSASQVLMTLWLIVDHRLLGSDRPVRLHAGLRGAGLFLLMFVVLAISENLGQKALAAKMVILVTNSLVILVGLLNLVGMKWVRQETLWLRRYLLEREAGRRPAE